MSENVAQIKDPIPNAWLVTCKGCGAYDLVGVGHPATRKRPDGTHELFDRAAIRHSHADGCEPNAEGNYPLDFSFTTVPLVVIGTAAEVEPEPEPAPAEPDPEPEPAEGDA